jgi:predicted KAP-like P-loop ATPase
LNDKSIIEVKDDIKDKLEDRNKKVIIIIDDIDRLNRAEMMKIL